MSEALTLPCTLSEQTSKKGTKYICLSVKLTPTLEKKVFLEPAEVEVVKLFNSLKLEKTPNYSDETGEIFE